MLQMSYVSYPANVCTRWPADLHQEHALVVHFQQRLEEQYWWQLTLRRGWGAGAGAWRSSRARG
jgi:hypothetical protein